MKLLIFRCESNSAWFDCLCTDVGAMCISFMGIPYIKGAHFDQ